VTKRGPYKSKPAPGTVAALVMAFRDSPRYRRWSKCTREQNDRRLGRFVALNGHVMVCDITRGDIVALRDSLAEKPGAANNWLKTLSLLFDYAMDLEWIAENPCARVSRLPPVSREGHPAWSEDHIEKFLKHWEPGTTANTLVRLILGTGAARVDVVKLGWQNVHGERLRYRRQKTAAVSDVVVDVPLLPDMLDLLSSLPKSKLTFLETVHGRARSPFSVTEDLRRWTAAAGLPPGLGAHGLRKSLARRLAEAGCSETTLMAWLGHESANMARHYCRAFSRARAADLGAERLTNISPPKSSVVRLKTE